MLLALIWCNFITPNSPSVPVVGQMTLGKLHTLAGIYLGTRIEVDTHVQLNVYYSHLTTLRVSFQVPVSYGCGYGKIMRTRSCGYHFRYPHHNQHSRGNCVSKTATPQYCGYHFRYPHHNGQGWERTVRSLPIWVPFQVPALLRARLGDGCALSPYAGTILGTRIAIGAHVVIVYVSTILQHCGHLFRYPHPVSGTKSVVRSLLMWVPFQVPASLLVRLKI